MIGRLTALTLLLAFSTLPLTANAGHDVTCATDPLVDQDPGAARVEAGAFACASSGAYRERGQYVRVDGEDAATVRVAAGTWHEEGYFIRCGPFGSSCTESGTYSRDGVFVQGETDAGGDAHLARAGAADRTDETATGSSCAPEASGRVDETLFALTIPVVPCTPVFNVVDYLLP